VLFPYARANMETFLRANWGKADVMEIVRDLQIQVRWGKLFYGDEIYGWLAIKWHVVQLILKL
jgi:methionine salvage enolase-phosphatase E1